MNTVILHRNRPPHWCPPLVSSTGVLHWFPRLVSPTGSDRLTTPGSKFKQKSWKLKSTQMIRSSSPEKTENDSLVFLDCAVKIKEDKNLSMEIYRKPPTQTRTSFVNDSITGTQAGCHQRSEGRRRPHHNHRTCASPD